MKAIYEVIKINPARNKTKESTDINTNKPVKFKKKSSIFASIKFDNLNEQNKNIISKTISSNNVVLDIDTETDNLDG